MVIGDRIISANGHEVLERIAQEVLHATQLKLVMQRWYEMHENGASAKACDVSDEKDGQEREVTHSGSERTQISETFDLATNTGPHALDEIDVNTSMNPR